MLQKRSKSLKKQQKTQKKQKLHWAVDLCSKVQMVMMFPLLFLLGFMIVVGILSLFNRIMNFGKNDKSTVGGIFMLIVGIIFSGFLFWLTIWVYNNHPSFLCAILISNLLFSLGTALVSVSK